MADRLAVFGQQSRDGREITQGVGSALGWMTRERDLLTERHSVRECGMWHVGSGKILWAMRKLSTPNRLD